MRRIRRLPLSLSFTAVAVAYMAIAAALVLLLSIRPIREALMDVWRPLPFVIFAVGVVLAVVVSSVIRGSLKKKYAELTHLDIFELPKLARMQENGWFVLAENRPNGITKMVFAKKRMLQGVFTGDEQRFDLPAAAENVPAQEK